MTDMQRIISNPRTNCFYCNGTYLYPYGNTPATDLTGGCEVKQNVDFLLLACGDIRNILFTLNTLHELKIKPQTLNFHVNDNEDVILARNLVLLAILDNIDPDKGEDLELLWSVWYDMVISKKSIQRVRRIINELLQHGHPMVKSMTQDCDDKIKYIFKYWLRKDISLCDITLKRNEFEKEKVAQKGLEFSLVSDEVYEEVQYQNWKQEVEQFLQTGSTDKGEHVQGVDNLMANPTLICPHVDGWRVYYSGTPFHSYNLYGLTEGQSLYENCLSQLKLMVQAWKQVNATNTICIKISFWLDDCLTLCNHILPSDMKFDFIHTSNIVDHVGLVNLLASCSGRLKTSGVLNTETLLWDTCSVSMENFLNETIGIPASYFPTVFGLHLAEDFSMGTSEPRRLSLHTGSAKVEMRWLEARKAGEKINIYECPDLLEFFRRLVRSCMLLDFPPKFASAKTPSSLVHVIRTMKNNVVGGAKALLDIINGAQPQCKTKYGDVFYPHESCLRAMWLAYMDELGCVWLKDENENDVLLFEIQINPVQTPARGIARLHMGKIYRNVEDIPLDKYEVPRLPWYLITSIAYDMTGKITFLLPSNVWSTLENSASITIYSKYGTLFESKNIKNDKRVKIIDRMTISTKPVSVTEIRKCLIVKEFQDRYEMHMNQQNSLHPSSTFRAELGSDATEVLLKCDKLVSTYRFVCPLLDVHTEKSLPDTLTITAEKNPDALVGPVVLKYRRLDIGSFPTERKNTEQFARVLNSNMKYQESCRTRKNEKNGDSFRNISSLVCTMLMRMKIQRPHEPLLKALFVVAGDRKPGQAFGHDSSDIYMYFNKCHIIDDRITLNLLWVDFKRVNQHIKEGKITRMEVDTYCFMRGLICGYILYVTKVDAVLLRKWLVLNTLKSTQQEDQKYQWLFSSFLQPLYAIVSRFDEERSNLLQAQTNPAEAIQLLLKNPETPGNVCSGCSRKAPDLKRCKRCMSVYYCGKKCQERDWPNHKKICKAK